jgi:hypothetical protein
MLKRNPFSRFFNPDVNSDATKETTEPEAIVVEVDGVGPKAEPRRMQKKTMATLTISFYGANKATVDLSCVDSSREGYFLQRLILDLYAETLFHLGNMEQAVQLKQYILALGLHLLKDGEVKRNNILGALLELLIAAYEDATLVLVIDLIQNEDGSFDSEFSSAMLPMDYYMPTAVLLALQHMLYTLSDNEIASTFMAVSAMHTFYLTKHPAHETQGRHLVVVHALQQMDTYARLNGQ